ncbi:MAG: choice-of-anchor B family protein [Bacteroidota bacterium]
MTLRFTPFLHVLALGTTLVLAPARALAESGPITPATAPVSKNVQLLAHLNAYTRYSACASYVHPDGREYAVLGTETGTSIVNITNPSSPYEVASIPGLDSFWREMKQYRTWIYVTTEAVGGGIQIISMADPEHPVLVNTWTGSFNREHTVEVDTTRALLVLNGTRLTNTMAGMHVMSLADPANPVDLGSYNDDYVHDCWVRGTRLYAFCLSSSGAVRVFDFSNPALPVEQASWVDADAHAHSGEPSKDGRYLFVCDEVNYSTLKAFDLEDLSTHPLAWSATVNPFAIVHNVHVVQDTAFVAWYTEGVRLFDVTDPSLPAEWGYYDTYPSYSGGFHGVWEVAPRFPSGTFIASDIESGLWVFRATPDYGVVKVRARDGAGQPMGGVDVVRAGFPLDSTRTGVTGGARIALPPGSSTLRVSRFGYETQYVTDAVAVGSQDSFVVVMTPLPAATLGGVVRRAGDDALIPDAVVTVDGTPLRGTSGANGVYAIPGTPGGIWTVRADRPGYAPASRTIPMDPGAPRALDFKLLAAAWYDSCDTDKGWSLADADDNADSSGRWVRAIPNGTSGPNAARLPRYAAARAPTDAALPGGLAPQHDIPAEGMLPIGPVAPDADATPGPGSGYCFVTGNGPPGSDPGSCDVDFGKTTLATPPLDLTGMTEPTLAWQRWFHMNTPGEPDSFVIQITGDGATWVTVRSIIESHPAWKQDIVRVKDYIAPSAAVRVRFIAQDQPPVEGIVEAGVDDFMAYDAALQAAAAGDSAGGASGGAPAALESPRPNPASREATVMLHLGAAGHVRVSVFDAAGRRVAALYDGDVPAGALALRWNGRDTRGRAVGSGLYWIRAEAAGERLVRKLVWIR